MSSSSDDENNKNNQNSVNEDEIAKNKKKGPLQKGDEKDDGDDDDENDAETNNQIKLNLRREFDPKTDLTCVAIVKLFKKNPDAKIARNMEFKINGEKMNVGKLIYALRTCYRNPKQNPLTKMRLKTLAHIKPLQTFLNMPILPKSKPSSDTAQICAKVQLKLRDLEVELHNLNIEIAHYQLLLAKQDQLLFTFEEENEKFTSKKRKRSTQA